MKIEIVTSTVKNKSGTSAAGKPYSINKQEGFLFTEGAKYPVRFEFNLADGATAFAPGMYSLCESSFYVDRFGALAVSGQLVLVPIVAGQQARPAA
ncbi:single-stranded DNA-binding protein [Aeromonas caviae]|uniref:single-stranded DNA-binding protein n=1 Tax=Aeromonas caviae TaxID=648 RepID=UPI002B45B007|nr:single-stranded DNA-binding protein [Aeromonas caviae]